MSFRLFPLAIAVSGLLLEISSARAAPVQGRIGLHLQTRLSWTAAADDPTTVADEGRAPDERAFELRRARLRGRWEDGGWRAKLLFAVDRGRPRLLNAKVTFAPVPWLRLAAGRFKRQVALDYLVGSARQRLYERSMVGDAIDSTRDVGVLLRALPLDKRLDLRLAILGGNAASSAGGRGAGLRVEARVQGHLGRRVDPEKRRIPRKPRLMLCAAAATSRIHDRTTTGAGVLLAEDSNRRSWSVGAVAQGWRHELRAEWIVRGTAPIDARTDPSAPWPDGLNSSRDGGYLQWAWLLPLSIDLEVSARAELYRPEGGEETRRTGLLLGAAWMPDKHLRLGLHGRLIDTGLAAGAVMRQYGVVLQLQVRL